MNHSQENFAPGQHFERANRRIADLPSNMRATRAGEDTLELGPHFQPGSFDVICARGNKAYQHVGNQRYRYMIESRMEQYASASNKFEKSLIVTQIVDEVRQASPGGGFVRYENGRWHEIGDHVAREKVGQRCVCRGSCFCNLRKSLSMFYSVNTSLFLCCPVFAINFIPSTGRAERLKSSANREILRHLRLMTTEAMLRATKTKLETSTKMNRCRW